VIVTRTVRAVVALVLLTSIYFWWVRLPLTAARSIEEAYLQGAVGGLLCGIALAFGVRHAVDAALLVCAAIIAGHALALTQSTSVALPVSMALEETITRLQRYHLVLMGLVIAGWGTGHVLRTRVLSGTTTSGRAVEQRVEADEVRGGQN
jgi:hypothetical protein